MGLTPDNFYDRLNYLLESSSLIDSPIEFIVAYSGGLDSTVLLHLMNSIRERLPLSSVKAIYVDHCLQAESNIWGQHCKLICDQLKIDFVSVALNAAVKKAESPEESARKIRYNYFKQHCTQKSSVLLTAHHGDDQTETLLLQLMRGSGPKGLASMPGAASFGKGHHLRPFLEFERQSLKEYASSNGLSWVEDPSNAITNFDRNYLRHKVVPVLKERWPSLSKTTFRSAKLAAEAAELLDNLAVIDYKLVRSRKANILEINALKQLSKSRSRNVIRYWVSLNGADSLSYAQTEQVLNMVNARIDASPLLAWSTHQIRCYSSKLYLIKAPHKIDPSWQLSFDSSKEQILLSDKSSLVLSKTTGEGLDIEKLHGKNLLVRYRQGGEICTPAGRKHRHRLKKLFNEVNTPPWERDRTPLIFVDDLLIAVVGQWYCEPYVLKKAEKRQGLTFEIIFN